MVINIHETVLSYLVSLTNDSIAPPLTELAKKTGKPKEDVLAEILNHPLILNRVEYYYRKARSRRGRRHRYKMIARWHFLFLFPGKLVVIQ